MVRVLGKIRRSTRSYLEEPTRIIFMRLEMELQAASTTNINVKSAPSYLISRRWCIEFLLLALRYIQCDIFDILI